MKPADAAVLAALVSVAAILLGVGTRKVFDAYRTHTALVRVTRAIETAGLTIIPFTDASELPWTPDTQLPPGSVIVGGYVREQEAVYVDASLPEHDRLTTLTHEFIHHVQGLRAEAARQTPAEREVDALLATRRVLAWMGHEPHRSDDVRLGFLQAHPSLRGTNEANVRAITAATTYAIGLH